MEGNRLKMINTSSELQTVSSGSNSATVTLLQKSKPKPKPKPSRLDYRIFNFCATCNLKFSKEVLRCPDCKQKVRVKPWHRPKIMEHKRL
jgi:DNA-directed RNA polymerase subunit RPC12/RpoP